jgi:hypothetical protein
MAEHRFSHWLWVQVVNPPLQVLNKYKNKNKNKDKTRIKLKKRLVGFIVFTEFKCQRLSVHVYDK